jgi:hypothetical protein
LQVEADFASTETGWKVGSGGSRLTSGIALLSSPTLSRFSLFYLHLVMYSQYYHTVDISWVDW